MCGVFMRDVENACDCRRNRLQVAWLIDGRGGAGRVGAFAYAPGMSRIIGTVVLLALSNVFMTLAWYGHLKWFGEGKRFVLPVIGIIAVSWLIALPEYCLQVPANRLGHVAHGGRFTAPQLKILQEAITLVVFAAFSVVVLKERLRTQDALAFGLVFLAVVVSVWGRSSGGDAGHVEVVERVETTP